MWHRSSQINKKRAKRASNPCEACRHRKSRCITRKNSRICTMCEVRESDCVFLNRAKQSNPTDDGNTNPSNPSFENSNPHQGPSTFLSPTAIPNNLWPNQQNVARFSDSLSLSRSVGMNDDRFGELYGLTSDMEPILMVRTLLVPWHL